MSTLHRGDRRSVLVIPSLGIAIKIAVIRWSEAWRLLKTAKRNHGRYVLGYRNTSAQPFMDFIWCQIFERTVEDRSDGRGISLKKLLFAGIVDNWHEYWFYKLNPGLQTLLQPTYATFFGIVNIQKYGKPIKESKEDAYYKLLYKAYRAIVGEGLDRDGHHFFYEGNFHLRKDGKVVFLDYGGSATRKILKEYGLEILLQFVPPQLPA